VAIKNIKTLFRRLKSVERSSVLDAEFTAQVTCNDICRRVASLQPQCTCKR